MCDVPTGEEFGKMSWRQQRDKYQGWWIRTRPVKYWGTGGKSFKAKVEMARSQMKEMCVDDMVKDVEKWHRKGQRTKTAPIWYRGYYAGTAGGMLTTVLTAAPCQDFLRFYNC